MTHLITNETRHIVEKLFTCRNVISYEHTPILPIFRVDNNSTAYLSDNTHVNEKSYNMTVVDNRPYYWKDVVIPDTHLHMKDVLLLKEAALIEDFIVLQGKDGDGLLYEAQNLAVHQLDFLTCGNGQIATDIALSLLEADGFSRMLGANLLLNDIQYHELITSFGRFGQSDYENVKRLLLGGSIYKTELPVENGLVLPLKEYTCKIYKVKMYSDWNVKRLQDGGDTYRIYASFEVEVNMPQMLCRIKNI